MSHWNPLPTMLKWAAVVGWCLGSLSLLSAQSTPWLGPGEHMVWQSDAGTDAAGRILKVVRLWRDTPDSDSIKGETWAVATARDGSIEKRLMETDPYHDRVEMEAESPGNLPGFEIGPNRLSITTRSSRGSWGRTTSWQLFPFKILAEHWEHHIPAGGADSQPPFFDASWDWGTLTGSGQQEVRRPCRQDNGTPGEFLFIPLIPRDQKYLLGGWKTEGIDSHSLEVTGDNAFLLAGRRGAGTVMRIFLASPTDLFIELPRTQFAANAKHWLDSDHLEIWEALGMNYEPELEAEQWGVQLADGQVFPGYGDPYHTPEVEEAVVQTAGKPPVTVVHVSLTDPVDDFGFLTVSYSASDKGERVSSLVATSQVCFGHGETLGLVKKIDFAAAGY